MFSITFTALSNLLQIKARICMFVCRAPAVCEEGLGGSAWLPSCATALCPCGATARAVSCWWGHWDGDKCCPMGGGGQGKRGGSRTHCLSLPGTSTHFISKYLPAHQIRLFLS